MLPVNTHYIRRQRSSLVLATLELAVSLSVLLDVNYLWFLNMRTASVQLQGILDPKLTINKPNYAILKLYYKIKQNQNTNQETNNKDQPTIDTEFH